MLHFIGETIFRQEFKGRNAVILGYIYYFLSRYIQDIFQFDNNGLGKTHDNISKANIYSPFAKLN